MRERRRRSCPVEERSMTWEGLFSHKRIISKKHFLEEKSIEQAARGTNPSPVAIARYANDFKRVRECLKVKWRNDCLHNRIFKVSCRRICADDQHVDVKGCKKAIGFSYETDAVIEAIRLPTMRGPVEGRNSGGTQTPPCLKRCSTGNPRASYVM